MWQPPRLGLLKCEALSCTFFAPFSVFANHVILFWIVDLLIIPLNCFIWQLNVFFILYIQKLKINVLFFYFSYHVMTLRFHMTQPPDNNWWIIWDGYINSL